MQDEHLYLQATQEVDENRQNREIWSKSLAMTGGDHFKSKYTYIPLRVAQLLREQGIDPETVPGLVIPEEADFETMDTGKFGRDKTGVALGAAAAGATAVAAGSRKAGRSAEPASRASAAPHPLDDLDDTMLVHNQDQQVETGVWESDSKTVADSKIESGSKPKPVSTRNPASVSKPDSVNKPDSVSKSNSETKPVPKPSPVESNRSETKMSSSSSASATPASSATARSASSSARLDNDPTLLPLSEFARLTGMSEADATLEIHRGSIASVTDDGAHYVKRDEVNSFVRKQAVTKPIEGGVIEEDADYAFKWLFAVVFAVALAYALYRFAPALVALFPKLAG